MELTTTWGGTNGETVVWEQTAGERWRARGTSDPGVSLAEAIALREDDDVRIDTGGAVPVAEILAALPDVDERHERAVVEIDGEAFGGFVGVGWVALDGELLESEFLAPVGRTLASASVSGGGFASGRMEWWLVEVRPGLLCDLYVDDHGHGLDIRWFEADPSDYVVHAVDTVSGAAYDDASSLALSLALEEGGGYWSGRELDPGEDNWNDYSFDFDDELVGQLPLPDPPMPRTFRVASRVIGGVYPGGADEDEARDKLESLVDARVTLFIDLTEPGEKNHAGQPLVPYEPLLTTIAEDVEDRKIRRVSIPVPDMTAPTGDQVREAVGLIDEEVADGGRVYVHCWGGKGRTGAVLGCWLASQGNDDPLDRLNTVRDPQMDDDRDRDPIPQTPEQRELVQRWSS